MPGKGPRLGLLAALGLIMVVLAAPAGASAAITTKLRTKTVNVPSGTIGHATATCPRGWIATAGGFQTSPPDLPVGTDFMVVHESRSPSLRRWRVSARQLGTGTGSLTSLAYCRRVPDGVEVRVRGVTVPASPLASRSVTPRCPANTRALGGGFRTAPADNSSPPFSGVVPWQDRRVGNAAWRVSAIPAGGNTGPLTLTGYAYCGDAAPGRARTASAPMSTAFLPALASATCPAGSKPVGGGFRSPVDEDSAPVFYESVRVPGRIWRAVAIQAQGGVPPNRIKSYAYCG